MNDHTTIEIPIARRIVRNALAKGYTVSVFDGEEWALKRSTDRAAINAALASTDSDQLRFRNAAGENVGSILLIYGNGPDVVSDMTDNAAMTALVGENSDGKFPNDN